MKAGSTKSWMMPIVGLVPGLTYCERGRARGGQVWDARGREDDLSARGARLARGERWWARETASEQAREVEETWKGKGREEDEGEGRTAAARRVRVRVRARSAKEESVLEKKLDALMSIWSMLLTLTPRAA